MLCRFCKGEVAEGAQKCNYCGSAPEQPAGPYSSISFAKFYDDIIKKK